MTTLDASTYFEHLRAYVNDRYVMDDGLSGKLILREKYFLDDTAKPWSKRCDFVIFYVNGRAFYADCIEFKSKSLSADKIVPQLRAGACWVNAIKHTIEHYTGDKRCIRVRKFVFAENENPDAYLDFNRQLIADPSIRYYRFDEVQGQPLADLLNTSVQEI